MTKPGEDQPLMDVEDLPTDIDHLMSLNPLALTPEARDAYLDGVIGYHRNLRVAKEKGVKVGRRRGAEAKLDGEAKPKLTLADLGLGGAPARPTVTRRV